MPTPSPKPPEAKQPASMMIQWDQSGRDWLIVESHTADGERVHRAAYGRDDLQSADTVGAILDVVKGVLTLGVRPPIGPAPAPKKK